MGLYARYVLPRLLDWALSRRDLAAERPGVLADAEEPVLEIGFGTGQNLPYYSSGIRRLSAVEPSVPVWERAMERIGVSPIEVARVGLEESGRVEADAESFATVVCTWTLCSVDDPQQVLAEVARVLAPEGRLLFIEHGLAPDARLARWQRRLTPLNRRLGGGCRLDRDVPAILEASSLVVERLDEFFLPHTPKLGGYTYRGAARKAKLTEISSPGVRADP